MRACVPFFAACRDNSAGRVVLFFQLGASIADLL
jgi:hypothetical protein